MVVTRLYFEIPTQSSDTEYTIDLAHELSKHHRRLVRQKQIFTVYGGIYQDSDNSNAYFSTAPHYWVTKRAINRGFANWRKQISAVMSNSGERSGKWSDFKVHLDNASTNTMLSAKDAQGTDLPSGEWNYTTLTRPRPEIEANDGSFIQLESDQFDLMITGPHLSQGTANDGSLNYTRVSLIKSWLDSRPLPTDGSTDSPNDQGDVTFSDPLNAMFYMGDADEDEKIIETIQDENDLPPYDLDLLYGAGTGTGNGASLQMQCIVSPDDNTGVASVAGFQAICGLVRIVVTGSTGNSGAALILDVESNGVGF